MFRLLQLKPTLAKFEKLDTLLSTTQYQGFQEEQSCPINTNILSSKVSLHKFIQASIAELDIYLDSKDIVYIDEKLRLLSKSAVLDATSSLFNIIVSESWAINSINEDQCISKMNDVDEFVVKHVLKLLGRVICEGTWCLDQHKILRASANLLFNRKFCDRKSV